MGILDKLGRRKKEEEPSAAPREEADLEVYNGMRVEVTSHQGQLLFVAKLLDPWGAQAKLRQFFDATISREQEAPLPVRIRGYSDRERKAVYMEGLILPEGDDLWKVGELRVLRVGNERAFFRMETDLEATATMFSGLEAGEKPCRMLNISVGGAGIQSASRYHNGDRFLLKVRLMPDKPTSAMFAQVVRVVEKEGQDPEYGCQFLEMTPEEEEKITQNIFAVQIQQRNRT